jgi:hypothetical protein
MKKLFKIIGYLLLTYVIIWIFIYVSCKMGGGCLWNIRDYWFPFPTCVCTI